MNWNLIKSIPKDGDLYLVTNKHGGYCLLRWDSGKEKWFDGKGYTDNPPSLFFTHWTELTNPFDELNLKVVK